MSESNLPWLPQKRGQGVLFLFLVALITIMFLLMVSASRKSPTNHPVSSQKTKAQFIRRTAPMHHRALLFYACFLVIATCAGRSTLPSII